MLKPIPSSAHLWGACSASLVALSEQHDTNEKTIDQLEGLAAHEYLENTLVGEVIEAGQTSSHGVPFTDEMIEAAEGLLEIIRVHNSTLDMIRGIQPFLVEHKVEIPSLCMGVFGRLDAGRVDPANRVIYVFEYKYGHGFVDEYFNPNGVLLAEGLRLAHGVNDKDWQNWSVYFCLAQPRCFDPRAKGQKIREHIYSGSEHMARMAHLKAMVIEAQIDPVATPFEGCGKCPRVMKCPAAQATAALICDISSRLPDNPEPTIDEMEAELRFLEDAQDRLSARETFLKAAVLGALQSGQSGRWYQLERGATTKQFNKTDKELQELQNLFKVEGEPSPRFMADPKPLTYLQARRLPENQALVAGGLFDDEHFTKEVHGKTSLKRINHNDAKRAFS